MKTTTENIKILTLPELDPDVPDEELKKGVMFARSKEHPSRHTGTNWFTTEKECLNWFKKECERHDWTLFKVTFNGQLIYEVFDEHAVKNYNHLKDWRKRYEETEKCLQCGREFKKNSANQLFCNENCRKEKERKRKSGKI